VGDFPSWRKKNLLSPGWRAVHCDVSADRGRRHATERRIQGVHPVPYSEDRKVPANGICHRPAKAALLAINEEQTGDARRKRVAFAEANGPDSVLRKGRFGCSEGVARPCHKDN
jgi:hypothetical protein